MFGRLDKLKITPLLPLGANRFRILVAMEF